MSETTFSADIQELGDKIANLTIIKAVELKNYLKEKYQIEAAAGGGVVMQQAGPAAAVAEKVEQTEFTVVLDDFDAAKKINVIKVVREITGLGLKEAKDLVEAKGKPVKENIAKEEAEKIKKQLEEGGAKISIK
jgi:large subunit ribosomal protein L7/L12